MLDDILPGWSIYLVIIAQALDQLCYKPFVLLALISSLYAILMRSALCIWQLFGGGGPSEYVYIFSSLLLFTDLYRCAFSILKFYYWLLFDAQCQSREMSKNASRNKKRREKQREKKAAEGSSASNGTWPSVLHCQRENSFKRWAYWIQVKEIQHIWTWLSYVLAIVLHISLLWLAFFIESPCISQLTLWHFFSLLRIVISISSRYQLRRELLLAIFWNSYLKQNYVLRTFVFSALAFILKIVGLTFISYHKHDHIQRPGYPFLANSNLLQLVDIFLPLPALSAPSYFWVWSNNLHSKAQPALWFELTLLNGWKLYRPRTMALLIKWAWSYGGPFAMSTHMVDAWLTRKWNHTVQCTKVISCAFLYHLI